MKTILKWLEDFTLSCEHSNKSRHFLFLLLTFFIVLSYGYYFGTFDQSSHIPFLKKTIDPTLFPHDHFFDLRSTHYSYFWLLFIPFYKLGLLEVSMFIVHLCATYITFWALWNLGKTLFNNTLTSLLIVVSSAFPHIGFSGFPLFEFSVLNRTVALPFELIAINYYLKKNYFMSFLILGILYNLHVLSVHFILAMIGIDVLFSLKNRPKVLNVMKTIPLFILCAIPLFIWKLGHSGVLFTENTEWFSILNNALFFHLFNFFSLANPIVILLTAGGLSAICLFFFSCRGKRSDKDRVMTHFMYAGIIILVAQLIATYWYPSTVIIQSQIIRVGIFMSLFAYMYFSHYVVTWLRKSPTVFLFLTSVLIFSFSPLLSCISLMGMKHVNTVKKMIVGVGISIVIFLIVLVTLLFQNLARPIISIWPEKTPFYDVQIWAKNHTAKDSLFITPPSKWWLYDIEWRVASERSTVSTLSELLEAAFDPSYISYWKPRFNDVAPGALAQFKGNYLANFKIAHDSYYRNSTRRFIALAKKYGASYLVVEKRYRYALPIAYENNEYTVYSFKYQGHE